MSTPEKNMLEYMIEQIANLLDIVEKNRHIPPPGEIPDEILEKLAKVEKDVDKFCKIHDGFFEKQNISPLIKNFKKTTGQLSDKNQRLMDRIANLKLEAEAQQQALEFTKNYINRNKKAGQTQAESAKSAKKNSRISGAIKNGFECNWEAIF